MILREVKDRNTYFSANAIASEVPTDSDSYGVITSLDIPKAFEDYISRRLVEVAEVRDRWGNKSVFGYRINRRRQVAIQKELSY